MKDEYRIRISGIWVPVPYKDRHKLVVIKDEKSGMVLFRGMPQKV